MKFCKEQFVFLDIFQLIIFIHQFFYFFSIPFPIVNISGIFNRFIFNRTNFLINEVAKGCEFDQQSLVVFI